MSITTVSETIGRIRVAPPESPIAVLRSRDGLNSIPANTVYAIGIIRRKDPRVIGVFNKDMDIDNIKRILEGEYRALSGRSSLLPASSRRPAAA